MWIQDFYAVIIEVAEFGYWYTDYFIVEGKETKVLNKSHFSRLQLATLATRCMKCFGHIISEEMNFSIVTKGINNSRKSVRMEKKDLYSVETS